MDSTLLVAAALAASSYTVDYFVGRAERNRRARAARYARMGQLSRMAYIDRIGDPRLN